MADITVRGFLNDPKEFTSSNGNSYYRFSLNERQKGSPKDPKAKEKDGKLWKAVYYNCTSFHDTCPESGTYVEIKGRLSQRHYNANDGGMGVSLDIVVDEVEVDPPKREFVPHTNTNTRRPSWPAEDPFGDI